MARMMPPVIDERTVSSGEIRVFRLLKDARGTDEWTCLHSLGLARHPTKRKAEADFVVITPQIVLVLEVKAGRVARHEGVWMYTNRFGETSTSVEGPFKQASSAMFALEGELKRRFGYDSRIARLAMGYGVLLPDISFTAHGPEEAAELVYDSRSAREGIVAFIERLTSFHRERRRAPRYEPTDDDRKVLVDYLRGDFEPLTKIAWTIRTAGEQLIDATMEQYAALDLLDIRPRVIVEGGAGTGKTLLACECAKRASVKQRSTAFVVFNRTLAAVLKARTQHRGVEVVTINQLFQSAVAGSSFSGEVDQKRRSAQQSDFFTRLLPEFAQLAFLETGPRYDELILDEAQDYISGPVLDALDACVTGGLEGGRWRIFLDSNNQGCVYGRLDASAMARVRRFGEIHLLTTNCRNTKSINDEAQRLSAPTLRTRARVDGPPVSYHFYSGRGQQALLKTVIDRLRKDGLESGAITVLSAVKMENAAIASSGIDHVILDEKTSVEIASGLATKISAATCASFKGLENDVVVLTDITDLTGEWAKATLYVGMTRARIELIVLLEEKLKKKYEQRIQEAIRQAVESEEAR